MLVGRMGLMSILVQLFHIYCFICLPAYLSIISLPCTCPFKNLIFLSVSCIAACSIMISKARGGRWKALLGADGSGLVLLPVLIHPLACLAFGTAAQKRTRDGGLVQERRPWLLLLACCLPWAQSLLLFWLRMRTSVAGILWASFASARRRSGACAEQAESWRLPRRSSHHHHHHHVGFHLWPSCFTWSRAVLKEKLEISLSRENLQVPVSCTGICKC